MNFKSSIKLQLQRNLEDLKPGKKQFPNRNLHYATSIGPEHKPIPNSDHYIRHSSVNLYKTHEPTHTSIRAQIESLKRKLEEKTIEIFRLSNEMKQRSVSSINHKEPSLIRIAHQRNYPPKSHSFSENKRRLVNRQSLLPRKNYEDSVKLFERSKELSEQNASSPAKSYENPLCRAPATPEMVKHSIQTYSTKMVTPTVYLTKKAPKALGDDPITGLPRNRSSSPFREVAISVSKSRQSVRPFF